MTGPTNLFTFQDVPGVPVWCRETWTRTLIYTGLGRNPYRLPVIVNALVLLNTYSEIHTVKCMV